MWLKFHSHDYLSRSSSPCYLYAFYLQWFHNWVDFIFMNKMPGPIKWLNPPCSPCKVETAFRVQYLFPRNIHSLVCKQDFVQYAPLFLTRALMPFFLAQLAWEHSSMDEKRWFPQARLKKRMLCWASISLFHHLKTLPCPILYVSLWGKLLCGTQAT